MNLPIESPAYFGTADRALFGWFGRGARTDMGIVFCPPLGYEAVCAHRTLRSAALRATGAGHATLRFDYDGSGDSSGADEDPARLGAWLDSIDAAITMLRERAGVSGICLWGMRMGATLAALAAQRRGDVDALVAVAPVIAGRQYLRQVRALALAGGTGTGSGELQEAAGFVTTSTTRAGLEGIDLTTQAPNPARRILLLERSDIPAEPRWQQAMLQAEASLQVQKFADYAGMLADPHLVRVPEDMIDRSLEWLVASGPATRPRTGTAAKYFNYAIGWQLLVCARDAAMNITQLLVLFLLVAAPLAAALLQT